MKYWKFICRGLLIANLVQWLVATILNYIPAIPFLLVLRHINPQVFLRRYY